jgi:hypothetical protein
MAEPFHNTMILSTFQRWVFTATDRTNAIQFFQGPFV